MNKTVLITGGSRGIGRVTAMRLLADGYNVAITFNNSADAAAAFEAEAKATLTKDGPSISTFKADVRDPIRAREVVDVVVHRYGGVDALINNAGIRRDALFYNMGYEQWHDVMETNIDGTWGMIKAALPAMMEQRSGVIVNVASLSALHGVVGQTNYSAAKGAMIAMTRSLAREVARSGIRVNCVAPGLVETDMTATLDPEIKREMMKMIPMRRMVRPDEVAAAISFLISDDASGITGQVLCIDGGASA